MKQPPLISAAARGDLAALEDLLRASGPDERGRGGETALMVAARRGRRAVVERLLAAGAEVDAATDAGNTALMYAAARNQLEIVTLLLDRGAQASHGNQWGLTALDWARWAADAGAIVDAINRVPAGSDAG